MSQKWKQDPTLHSCNVVEENGVLKKQLDYTKTYIKEFLDSDPLRDWESIERCIYLWKFCSSFIDVDEIDTLLDCGTKDGQFVDYIRKEEGIDALGIEISKPYVTYAQSQGRNVDYGNVCDLQYNDNTFDFVFSHHVLGLTPDYFKALSEMYRVSKRYMVTLNDVPGNKRKHYSYIDSPEVFDDWLKRPEFEGVNVLYSGRNDGFWGKSTTEWILFLEKK